MKDNAVLPTFEDIFMPVRVCFRLVGVPFVEKRRATPQFYFIYIFLFIVDVEQCSHFLPKLETGDILEITSLIPSVLNGSITLIKFTFLFMKIDKIIKVTNRLSQLYENIRSDSNKASVVRKEVNFLKTITKYYYMSNICLGFVYCLKDFIWVSYLSIMGKESGYTVPFPIKLPVPIDNYPIWLFADLQCNFGSCICIAYAIASDVLYCILTSHVCINMSVISDQLENIEPDDYDALSQTVEYHQDVLELSNEIEDIFSGPNFFIYLSATIQICVLVFDLTIVEWKHIPRYAMFLICIILQIFLMSIFGEQLIREKPEISNACFDYISSEWKNRRRRVYQFVVQHGLKDEKNCIRTMRPQKLTAYKLQDISYASFSKIISSSWSYFTILKTVYNPGDK